MSIRFAELTAPDDLYSKTLPSLVQRIEALSFRLAEYDAALRSFSLDQLQAQATNEDFQDQASYFYQASGQFLETADALNEKLTDLDSSLLETHRLNMRNHLATYDSRCTELNANPSIPNLENLTATLRVLAIERDAIARISQASLSPSPTKRRAPAMPPTHSSRASAASSESAGRAADDAAADEPECVYEPMVARPSKPNVYEPVTEFRSPGKHPTLRSEGSGADARPADALFEGWMTKCGAFPKNWKTRYFRLFPDRLDYFLDEHSETAKGSIPLHRGCSLLPKSECATSWPALAQRVPDEVCFGIAPTDHKRVYFVVCAEDKPSVTRDLLVANSARWKTLLRRDPSMPPV